MSAFLDTNILIYAISDQDHFAAKQHIARREIDAGNRVLSVQVLNEFVVQATATRRVGHLTHDQALAFVEQWRRYPVIDLNLRLFDQAAEVQRRTQYSWWDSLVVAAAIAGGCDTLLTEDLQHGRVIDGVRIENPFITAG